MSVTGTPRLITIRPFTGYRDPSLPIAMWLGSANVTGDGSLGVMSAIIAFTLASAPRSGNLYSLEQVTAHATLGAPSHNFRLTADNMESISSDGINQRFQAVGSFSSGPDTIAADLNLGALAALRGIFLGTQAIGLAMASLILADINEDTSILTLIAQGYVWGPRSVLAEGGPSRPLQGLYRP